VVQILLSPFNPAQEFGFGLGSSQHGIGVPACRSLSAVGHAPLDAACAFAGYTGISMDGRTGNGNLVDDTSAAARTHCAAARWYMVIFASGAVAAR